MKKILIATGGTGGHVIPAKIIQDHLKNNFEIFYSTDLRGLRYLSSKRERTVIIDTPKLNINLFFPFKIIKLLYLTIKIIFFLKRKNIEKVISIGGYMSVPAVIGAKILRLTILLFEPNIVLGRSNKFFLNFSKKIFCYSDRLTNFPKKYVQKIALIKPLISKDFYELKKNEKFNDKFCFLICGGSQGAKFFDELIKDVMLDISKNFTIKIIQQTSTRNIKDLTNFYNTNNIESKIFSFEKNFGDLINMSDFCITRAGATSLAEISFLNKPFIAIPLPTSKDNHQMKNAEFYKDKGCCWVLDQKNLNKEKLLNFLSDILKEKTGLIEKKSNLKKLNYDNSWNTLSQKLQKIINEN